MKALSGHVLGYLVVTAAVASASSMWLQAQTTKPAFEVAAIRPNADANLTPDEFLSSFGARWARQGGAFSVTKVTAASLVVYAYDLKSYQVVGGPDWIRRERFTINAKAEGDVPESHVKLVVQSLLEDRFKMVSHEEQRDMPFRALVLAHADGHLGPYMRSMGDTCTREDAAEVQKQFRERIISPESTGGMIAGSCSDLDRIAGMLTRSSDIPVLDKTGVRGKFTYDLRYGGAGSGALSGELFDALEDQLGLRLKADRGPIRVMVIDSMQPPTEN